MANLYVGLSGFSYKEWQGEGLFYPVGLKKDDYFKFYGGRYNALESVGSAYATPTDATVARWIAGSPDGFRISPKMHQKVTHLTRLKPAGFEALQTFIKALAPLEAAGKCGPVLLQLPPNMVRNDDLLRTFFAEIPVRDSLLWSMEFRHPSWKHPEVEELLRDKGVGWVEADTEGVELERHDTASHVYARLRKDDYDYDALRSWAEYLSRRVAEGRDCYVYVKHQDAEAPWKWADRLLELYARASGS